MRYIFLIGLSFLISSYTCAQNFGKVNGWVSDSASGNAIKDVEVLIEGTNNGTTTDSSGYFYMKLPAGKNYTLVFSHIAYENKVKKIFLTKGEEVEYNIRLMNHPILLPPVLKLSYFDYIRSTFTFNNDELRKAGGNDLVQAIEYLDPYILYPNWIRERFNLKNNLNNTSNYNFTLYVNGKLVDSIDLGEISVNKIKYIKVWKKWSGVDMAPPSMPLVEGDYVVLVVTK